MNFFPILFLLAVAAGEARDEICNSRKTPTNLIARRTWPGQTATTTAKPTTDTTTASPKSTTTTESSTVSTTAPTTTTTTAGTSTTGIPSTTSPKSSSTMLSSTSTTMATTTPSRPIFTCAVDNPACGNMCTNATSAGTGVVQSPNFPGDYGIDYYGCTVTIIVPIGKRIQLTYTTFNLETYAAVLQVSDKNTVYVYPVSGNTIPAAITTSSNVVYMIFNSYGSTKPNNAIYNWQATYTAV